MDLTTILLLVVFAGLMFFMFRRSRKQQQDMQNTRNSLVPGVEVMTSFGLFGTVVAVDSEDNKIVIETAPGTRMTVHSQTVTKIITPTPAPEAVAGEIVVPDDVSSLQEAGNADEKEPEFGQKVNPSTPQKPASEGVVEETETSVDQAKSDQADSSAPQRTETDKNN